LGIGIAASALGPHRCLSAALHASIGFQSGLDATKNDTTSNRGFTGQGPDGFRRRHLSLPGSGFRRRQGPRSSFIVIVHPKANANVNVNARELRPNPIRSDTSCHGIAAPPDGDSGGAPTIPPRAASSALPRRRSESAAPEVPSIDEPTSAGDEPVSVG
jgi:hypothetical protein